MTSSIKKNFAYSTLYQVLIIIVPLVTSPYLARTLGAESIGINSWTHSIATYFQMLALLGIGNYGNRTIASVRADKEKRNVAFCGIYICQLVMSVLMIISYTFFVIYAIDNYRMIFFIQGLYILTSATDITWFFYGMEEFKTTVLKSTFARFLSLACIFIFVKCPDDLWKYALILSASSLLANILTWPQLLKHVRFSIPSIKNITHHIKPIIVLFAPVLAISVFTNMDRTMIGYLSSVAENGYYENTYKIIGVPKSIITALGTVMLPHTANLIASGKEEKSNEYIKTTILYTMIVSSPLVFGMAAVANVFSVVFWGEAFRTCGLLIACIAPSITFSVLGSVVRTQYLIPRSKDKEYIMSLIVGAIVNFNINMSLIPKLGAFGAVIGTVVAEFVMTFIQFYFVRKILNPIIYLCSGIPFYVIGLLMYIVVKNMTWRMNESVYSLTIQIIIGALIYLIFTSIFIMKSKNKDISNLKTNIIQPFLRKMMNKNR